MYAMALDSRPIEQMLFGVDGGVMYPVHCFVFILFKNLNAERLTTANGSDAKRSVQ